MSECARLLSTKGRRQEPTALPETRSPRGLHSQSCGVAVGGGQLRSGRGQRTPIALELRGSNPLKFGTREQVGQESNRRPAVLEPAAVRSAAFTEVHEGARNRPFEGPKYVEVHQSSPALGSTVGSNAANKALCIGVD